VSDNGIYRQLCHRSRLRRYREVPNRSVCGLTDAGSDGASSAPPPGHVGQHEEVHAREKHQREGANGKEPHPVRIFAFDYGHAIEDDNQRKGNRQPAVQLPNPFAPVQ
jgi:hypothetical protein